MRGRADDVSWLICDDGFDALTGDGDDATNDGNRVTDGKIEEVIGDPDARRLLTALVARPVGGSSRGEKWFASLILFSPGLTILNCEASCTRLQHARLRDTGGTDSRLGND